MIYFGKDIEEIRKKKAFICDMDGVVYHGNEIIPGVKEFIAWVKKHKKKFLFLTNNSGKSPKELETKLSRMGLDVDESHFYTSAQATARFLSLQSPGCSAFVVGEPYLYNALYSAGITINDYDPDYVVIGETYNYNLDAMCKAMRLVEKGARLIGTNSDLTYPNEEGNVPACRALVSPLELTTGVQAYYVGKPNPLMMRTALHMMNVHSADAVMIGDRMDTDIIAGIESGLASVLVLTGVSDLENIKKFPYRPRYILDKLGDIAE